MPSHPKNNGVDPVCKADAVREWLSSENAKRKNPGTQKQTRAPGLVGVTFETRAIPFPVWRASHLAIRIGSDRGSNPPQSFLRGRRTRHKPSFFNGLRGVYPGVAPESSWVFFAGVSPSFSTTINRSDQTFPRFSALYDRNRNAG